jgi:hypothetical protein
MRLTARLFRSFSHLVMTHRPQLLHFGAAIGLLAALPSNGFTADEKPAVLQSQADRAGAAADVATRRVSAAPLAFARRLLQGLNRSIGCHTWQTDGWPRFTKRCRQSFQVAAARAGVKTSS